MSVRPSVVWCSARSHDVLAYFGAVLIAEGIETPGELDTVTSLSIGAGQGYLLCPPSTRPEEWAHWAAHLSEEGQTGGRQHGRQAAGSIKAQPTFRNFRRTNIPAGQRRVNGNRPHDEF